MQHESTSEQLVEGSLKAGAPRVHLHLRLRALEFLFAGVPPWVAGRTRTYAMRAAGLRIGKASIFWGLPTLAGSGEFERRLSVGTDCGFNAGSFFDLEESITIGDHVAVGHDVMFLTTTSRSALAAGSAGALRRGPIVIGNGVWLGARAMVLPGVTIGKSSVIGAGVVVTEDVPENTLLTGATKLSIARWR